jgi:hypothetical protein
MQTIWTLACVRPPLCDLDISDVFEMIALCHFRKKGKSKTAHAFQPAHLSNLLSFASYFQTSHINIHTRTPPHTHPKTPAIPSTYLFNAPPHRCTNVMKWCTAIAASAYNLSQYAARHRGALPSPLSTFLRP